MPEITPSPSTASLGVFDMVGIGLSDVVLVQSKSRDYRLAG